MYQSIVKIIIIVMNNIIGYFYPPVDRSSLPVEPTTKTFVVGMTNILAYSQIRHDDNYLVKTFGKFFRSCFDIQHTSLRDRNLRVVLDNSNARVRHYCEYYKGQTTLSTPTFIHDKYYDDLQVMIEINIGSKQVISLSMLKCQSDGKFSDQIVKFDMSELASAKFVPITMTMTTDNRINLIGDILEELGKIFYSKVFPYRVLNELHGASPVVVTE